MGHIKDRWYTRDKRPTARHGKGLRWQVWYRVEGREKCGGSFKIKAVAERKLVELESSLLRGQWVDPNDQTTVVELVTRRLTSRTYKPRTAARLDVMIRNHVEATTLGDRRIVSVKPSDVQAWVTDRAQHLAPGTMRILVTLVKASFTDAVADNLIAANPFQRISLPRVQRERIVPLTVGQVRELVSVISPRYKAMVITQAGLGLRVGELLALRVQDVNWLGRSVRIEHQVDRFTRELVDPKTPRSRRTVPLPDVVSEALAGHLATFPPADSGLLFHTRDGRPIMHDWYQNKVFAAAVREAKLPKGTTSHTLRHHFASVLLAAGESVVAVAERLGHDNANLVLSTYGHLLPDMEDRTRKAIDGAWQAESGSSEQAVAAQGRPE